MNFDTYIFDLDGTLLDTLDDLQASCNHALAAYGLPVRTKEEVRQFVGNGVRLLMERAVGDEVGDELFEKIFDAFKAHYLEHGLDKTRPYSGIIEMLSGLKENGKKIAVVSNKFHTATVELCQHFFGKLVDVAVGENEAAGLKKKPATDIVDEAFRRLGVGKSHAVYVGDSDVDLQTARNSQLPCISVLWGFRDREFLMAHGATLFAEFPSDLL